VNYDSPLIGPAKGSSLGGVYVNGFQNNEPNDDGNSHDCDNSRNNDRGNLGVSKMEILNKQFRRIGIAIVILVAIGACLAWPQINQTGLFAMQPETIQLGWVSPLTGEQGSFGKTNLEGIMVAIDEINETGGINGKKLSLLTEDDKGLKEQALSGFEKLTKINNIDYILTTSYSNIIALAPNAEQNQTLLISAVDTSDEIAALGEWAFGVGIYDEGVGISQAEFIYNKLKEKNVAILYDNGDAFYALVRAGFKKKYAELGGKISVEEGFTPTETDFRAILEKVKNAGSEAILLLGYDNAGFAVKQARERGINATIIGGDNAGSETFFRNSKNAAAGMYFTAWEATNAALSEKFLKRYKEKYGHEPEQYIFSATGYDTIKVLAQAMKQCKIITKECVKEKLYSTKNYEGLTGTLTMSPDGVIRTVKEEIFVRNEDGTSQKAE
jgi:branched-chain amino acid transport system substrate-binding protein